jgi:hypothetical protein
LADLRLPGTQGGGEAARAISISRREYRVGKDSGQGLGPGTPLADFVLTFGEPKLGTQVSVGSGYNLRFTSKEERNSSPFLPAFPLASRLSIPPGTTSDGAPLPEGGSARAAQGQGGVCGDPIRAMDST